VSDQNRKHSDLVEIAKRTAVFKEHYGKWWGGFLQLQFANAATGRRPFLWGGLISLGTAIGGLMLRYGVPHVGG
jgi:hypothetical protein